MTEPAFVDIQNLNVTFTGGREPVHEVVALIRESGSGKSVALRSLLRLHNERRATITGRIRVGDSCRETRPPVVILSPQHAARCLRTDATLAVAA